MGLPLTELPKVAASTIFSINLSNGIRSFTLKTKSLSAKQCHMFFPANSCIELLIITALEYTSFHPGQKGLADLFQIKIIECGGIPFMWCSFPKGYEDTCRRIGNVYNMTMTSMNRIMGLKEVQVKLPNHENVICFEGPRKIAPEAIDRECSHIQTLAAWAPVTIESLRVVTED